MTEIRFYHLQRSTLERALAQLLEKTLERGWRAVVKTGSEERREALAGLLWTQPRESFLPHGTARDGNAEHQPVWLTAVSENPNRSHVLFLTDGVEGEDASDFGLCCELFDGNDEAALAVARRHWTEFRAAGHALTYWQQNAAGAWEKKAEA